MRKRNKRNANRKVKDSVFVDLFSKDKYAKQNFLELYNCLSGKNLKLEDTKIECVNLENVLYMTFYNDVSMLIDGKIVVLCEHQSTVNENMPLRFLIYLARIYEKIISREDKFAWKQIRLAKPEFYVFYNGNVESYPEVSEMKLSDAYYKEFSSDREESQLELKVKVYNLNKCDRIPEISSCKPMSDYSKFIQCVERERKCGGDYLKRAIMWSEKNQILTEYLNRKSSEVFNMLLSEYDYKLDMNMRFKEGYSDGYSTGRDDGILQGRTEGIQAGLQQGIEKGMQQGIEKGIEQGIERGIEQGFQQGIQKGLFQGANDVLAYLSNGHSIEEAMKKFGQLEPS